MAEKTNKSTTILLLVVAGALLFLVGSFTGQITFKDYLESKRGGLTDQQKQEVLNMLNGCMNINLVSETKGLSEGNENVIQYFNSGDSICSQQGKKCILESLGQQTHIYSDNQIWYETNFLPCKEGFNAYPFEYKNGAIISEKTFRLNVLCC